MNSSVSCLKRKPYVSCITIEGRPILPPLMTSEKIKEMQEYKKLAVELEVKLKLKNNLISPTVLESSTKEAENTEKKINDNLNSDNTENASKINNQPILLNISVENKKLDEGDSNAGNCASEPNDNAKDSTDSDSLSETCDQTVLQKLVDKTLNQKERLNNLDAKEENVNNEITITILNSSIEKSGKSSKFSDPNINVSSDKLFDSYTRDIILTEKSVEDSKVASENFLSKSEKRKYFSEFQNTDYFKTCWLHWNDYNTPTETFTSPGPVIVEGLGTVENEGNPENQDQNSHIQDMACLSKSSNVSVLSSRTCTDQSTPPSLASTELNKYMTESPEAVIRPHLTVSATTIETVSDLPYESDLAHLENEDSVSQNSTLNSSSVCTTKVKGHLDEFNLIKQKMDTLEKTCVKATSEESQAFTPPKLVRRLSYTLECPSPALMAHAEECEKNGLPIKNDMSSVRRHSYPMITPSANLEEKFSVQVMKSEIVITSDQDEDNFSFLKNKKEHLHRYLENLSKCPSGTEANLPDSPNDRESSDSEEEETNGEEEGNLIVENSDRTEVENESLEDILKEKQKYYENMRVQLEEQHQQQMEMLMKQQRQEELLICEQFLGISENIENEIQTSVSKENFEVGYRKRNFKYFPSPIVSEAFIRPNCIAPFPLIRESKESISLNIPANQTRVSNCSWLRIDQLSEENIEPSLQAKFNRLSAAVKGYLTRRLLMTDRVQQIIQTIRDTLEFALAFNEETPIKSGRVTSAEVRLHNRIISQLTGACYDFHDIFFTISTAERMNIIAQDRRIKMEKTAKNQIKGNLSSATLKTLERKKMSMQGESSRRQVNNRSKSSLPWSFSPKRRKVSTEILSRSNCKPDARPKTTSPQSYKANIYGGEKQFCNAKKSLASIYSPSQSKVKSGNGNKTFRVSLRNRFTSGATPSSSYKSHSQTPAWK